MPRRSLCGIKGIYLIPASLVCLFLLVIVTILPVLMTRKRQSTPPFVQWTDVTSARGDHLPDFSYCGYRASEIPVPLNENRGVTVLVPRGGDQTVQLQSVLDATAAEGGGIVTLGEGTFIVSAGLHIPSGVVLRGAGVDLTLLTLSQLGQAPLISLGGNPGLVSPSVVANVVDHFIPIGTSQLTVDDVSGFKVGQSVFVQRRVTADWVRANGMSDLVLDGVLQTWLPVR